MHLFYRLLKPIQCVVVPFLINCASRFPYQIYWDSLHIRAFIRLINTWRSMYWKSFAKLFYPHVYSQALTGSQPAADARCMHEIRNGTYGCAVPAGRMPQIPMRGNDFQFAANLLRKASEWCGSVAKRPWMQITLLWKYVLNVRTRMYVLYIIAMQSRECVCFAEQTLCICV